MEGPPLGTGGGDITWPDQVAPRGRKASSTRKIKPQTSNLLPHVGQEGEVVNPGLPSQPNQWRSHMHSKVPEPRMAGTKE